MSDAKLDALRGVVVREVIEVKFTRGAGVKPDPVRMVTAYFTTDGEFLAESDPTFEKAARLVKDDGFIASDLGLASYAGKAPRRRRRGFSPMVDGIDYDSSEQ